MGSTLDPRATPGTQVVVLNYLVMEVEKKPETDL